VYEGAIIDAVGDDANAPVCDSSNLREVLLLTGGINYPCPQVARCPRDRGHATGSPAAVGRGTNLGRRRIDYRPE